jgi:chitin disaccharide deacetylase
MCHPGHPDEALAAVDDVTDAREGEFTYLHGPDFPADIAAAGLCLGRFRELAAP